MGHHHKAAISADVNAGGFWPGQLSAQNTYHTKAHGSKPTSCKVSVGNLCGPILLHPRLIVANIREHNGILWCHFANVGNQATRIDGIGITLTIRRDKVLPFLPISSNFLMPNSIVTHYLLFLRHIDQLGEHGANISYHTHIYRIISSDFRMSTWISLVTGKL